MPRPRRQIPAGTVFGHFRVVDDAPDVRGGRAFLVESTCCGSRRIATHKSLTANQASSSGTCRKCSVRRGPSEEQLAKARASALQKRLERRAGDLVRRGLTPGRAVDEIVAWHEVEPSSIRTMTDFRRAQLPDGLDGLCGTVRAVCREMS